MENIPSKHLKINLCRLCPRSSKPLIEFGLRKTSVSRVVLPADSPARTCAALGFMEAVVKSRIASKSEMLRFSGGEIREYERLCSWVGKVRVDCVYLSKGQREPLCG
ncbi:MAG: hypothetical protein JW384_01361 [Nitrosomonadaceae bacterium]|nr:hypothetical protein [Nitrosomonadaceae bacterium]